MASKQNSKIELSFSSHQADIYRYVFFKGRDKKVGVFERQQIKICEKTQKVNDADLAENNIKKSKHILEWNFLKFIIKSTTGKKHKEKSLLF